MARRKDMTDVERLVEEMATSMPNTIPFFKCKAISDELLRIVLQSVQRGDVARVGWRDDPQYQCSKPVVVLKPSYKEFLDKI